LPTGFLVFLAIALPWHILVQQANPEFFRFYIIDQQFIRYLTKAEGRYQPVWFYIPIIILGIFPWSGFLIGALKRIRRTDVLDMFFIIWAAVIFLFFSLSDSKLVPYVLPCFPPLAILIGRFFADSADSEERTKKTVLLPISIGFWTTSSICILFVIAILVALSPKITTNFHVAQHWAILIIICLLINAIFAPWLYYRKSLKIAFIGQLCFSTAFLFSVCAVLPYIYMDSIKPMAMQLNTVLKPSDMIATYDYYYQDLPFYLQRTVTIVNWGGELKFGQEHQDDKNDMIDDPTFWRAWQSPQMVYMMVARDLFADLQKKYPYYHFYLFANGKNDLVVANHPRSP
jgi:4-amino-4-deoxy-L-arabinose transferase-like glycosyltransferase